MQKWEYLEVTRDVENNSWRPRYVNGQELRDWKRGPNWFDYWNQLGDQGWELVAALAGQYSAYGYVFKRAKP